MVFARWRLHHVKHRTVDYFVVLLQIPWVAMKQLVYFTLKVNKEFFLKWKKIIFSIEIRRTRRAHSARPGEGDTSPAASRQRSPSPVRSSGKDTSWRDKLGAGDKPARDTLDVEKPSKL